MSQSSSASGHSATFSSSTGNAIAVDEPDDERRAAIGDGGPLIKIGVAAMDRKARSKPMRNILSRVLATNKFEIVIFGDKVITDEDIENWPICDFLISFFSTGFPMDKAIRYVALRHPVCINDLPLQKLFWDRRLVISILDAIGVPTPKRVEVSRDGGPIVDKDTGDYMMTKLGIRLDAPRPVPEIVVEGDSAIVVDGVRLTKPFVEKPASGEDHNVHIYFGNGRGGRKLFRKIGNQSSTLDSELCEPRMQGSYVYEQFMNTDNSEDIKIYTLGPNVVHAESRKSPVVDGVVRRNLDGKEIRYVTQLTPEEKEIARKISSYFGQNICGFDLLRAGGKSYVIDVNGWSFVKGNDQYYDKCAEILVHFCQHTMPTIPPRLPPTPGGQENKAWCLKGSIMVFRHADRTPKSKLKFNFKGSDPCSVPFIRLLQDRRDEIILRDAKQLHYIAEAAEEAMTCEGVDTEKLRQLQYILSQKKGIQALKAQLKPTFGGDHGEICEKMNIVIKWGGEYTHAARHQSRDIGENIRQDLRVMNKELLKNVTIFTSSERRVVSTAEIFSAALLDNSEMRKNPQPHELIIRKDLLDDSNAAKEPMDLVKKRLKVLLRRSHGQEDFNWPIPDKEPVDIVREVMEIMRQQREVMNLNWKHLDLDSIQSRWCCGEQPFFFRERWDKLFADWCDVDVEKVDPSRVSELYDSLKYDSLHNRIFLETIFSDTRSQFETETSSISTQSVETTNANGTLKGPKWSNDEGEHRLKELYAHAKVLFDLIAPQEYGIEQAEKREIGLLTSLPLLQKIIDDLKEARKSKTGLANFYFTKESHMHTLVNLVKLSSLELATRDLLELDYMAYMAFEVYERVTESGTKEHSVRIGISEGAHGMPLDTSLDAKHALQVLGRRKLIDHTNLDQVIASLEDWGEDLHAIKKSTTPYDGFLPIEGDELFLGKKRPAIDIRHFIPDHTRPPSTASSTGNGD